MNKDSKIFVAGHRGMVGSSIVRKLTDEGYTNLVLKTSSELDLREGNQVADFFNSEKPAYVFLAAAKVGGILANSTYPADFLYDNLMIQNNVIHQSFVNKVTKLLFLGSSCIYPKLAPQPLKEEYLLSGYLEPTNEPYAVAKIAGIKLCESYRVQHGCDFISAMPTNLYGPNDNFNLQTSHVVPALIRKIVEAKENGNSSVEVWGSGTPLREFLHVDDMADACIHLMLNYSDKHFVNVGFGKDLSIKELALLIKKLVGFEGDIVWDSSKPDGTPRKLMDVSKLSGMNWAPKIALEDGLKSVIEQFKRIPK